MFREEIEICPYCEKEIAKKWDVENNGYQVTCPNCGKKIMLCDACLHSKDNKTMRCNWSEENGCFRQPKEKYLYRIRENVR